MKSAETLILLISIILSSALFGIWHGSVVAGVFIFTPMWLFVLLIAAIKESK